MSASCYRNARYKFQGKYRQITLKGALYIQSDELGAAVFALPFLCGVVQGVLGYLDLIQASGFQCF